MGLQKESGMKTVLIAWAMAIFTHGAWYDYELTQFRTKESCVAMGELILKKSAEVTDFACIDIADKGPNT
jgi:hypothetical protein